MSTYETANIKKFKKSLILSNVTFKANGFPESLVNNLKLVCL